LDVTCRECGTVLHVNPNLGGVTMRCPRCGAEIRLQPKAPEEAAAGAPRPARRARAKPEPPRAREAAPARPRPPATLWLLLAQLVLLALGGSCVAGAFFKEAWGPAPPSYFHEPPPALALAGVLYLLLSVLARRLPVLAGLAGALAAMWAGAIHFQERGALDASRTVALALAMLALWLGLQHRRAVR